MTLLPSASTCFRTWRPVRGPVRSLLKGPPLDDQQSARFFWLTGPPAALWEAIEPGITLGRLRRRAEALQVSDQLESLLQEWQEAGLMDRVSRFPAAGPGKQRCTTPPPGAPRAPPAGSLPSLTPTHLTEVQAWMRSQGLAFSASWALDQPIADVRQAIERLDFLRRCGVFQIRFTAGSLARPDARLTGGRHPLSGLDPHHEHIRLAARALGFECIGPDL